MKYLKEAKKILPIFAYSFFKNEELLHASIKNLYFCVFCLKNHINYQYKILSCISGVDNLHTRYRFSVVYEFLSLIFNQRIRLKIALNETAVILSITEIFENANWWEREIWDLYGLCFQKHPDLRRILTDYGFEGHPMRKDFPLFGFIELRYDSNKKQIVTDKIELSQNFRFFSFETPW